MSIFLLAIGMPAHAQGSGMMGGTSGMMGFGSHLMDHNLVIPQLAVGQDYVSTLSLINLGNIQMMNWVPAQDLGTTGTVYFYKQDGSPMLVAVNGSSPVSQMPFSLSPSETARFDLTAAGATMAGWAFVNIDSTAGSYSWGMMDGQAMTGGMRVMANVSYAYQNGSQVISRVGVPASMYQMGHFFNSDMPATFDTGVAVVNMGAQTTTIQLQLNDANGQMIANKQILLPAGNQIARFVSEMFDGLPADFQGFLHIQTSDEGVVAMGLMMTDGIMTSIPMLHYGQVSMM
jgi:hypothetical protein